MESVVFNGILFGRFEEYPIIFYIKK